MESLSLTVMPPVLLAWAGPLYLRWPYITLPGLIHQPLQLSARALPRSGTLWAGPPTPQPPNHTTHSHPPSPSLQAVSAARHHWLTTRWGQTALWTVCLWLCVCLWLTGCASACACACGRLWCGCNRRCLLLWQAVPVAVRLCLCLWLTDDDELMLNVLRCHLTY